MAEDKVCRLDEVPDMGGKALECRGRHIALFRLGNEVFALEEQCPHRGAPLSEGGVHEETVRCPWHDAKFDIRTGKVQSGPAKRDLKRYAVRISNGEVFVGEEIE